MFQPKTHFEQIPLEAVKKIVAEQARQEEATEALQRERLQVVARDAGGQSNRPNALSAVLQAWIPMSEQLPAARESPLDEIGRTCDDTARTTKRIFVEPL